MGKVYLAHDDDEGAKVAIKVLHDAQDGARFKREAEVLEGLQHPGIVRYVDRGTTASGQAYLVTEWLEGETLSERLARGTLSMTESVLLARRVAEALGAAHRQGVVHRDIKPSNLFLVDRAVDDVRVLDFGIARVRTREQALTMTGAMLGTVGYMAPEQARGDRGIDAQADVFSLGCVIFRCLTGRPVFTGDDMLAVLLKVVMEEAPRLTDLRPDVPPTLDALIARMLAKVPEERPPNGDTVAEALAALGEAGDGDSRPPSAPSPRELASGERKVMALVVARGLSEFDRDRKTLSAGEVESQERALRAAEHHWKGKFDRLADGSRVITLTSAAAATDLAAQAARCALTLRGHLDGAVAVVLGWGEVTPRVPVGELIDRAAELLGRTQPGCVCLDSITAGLLDASFDVEEGRSGLLLRGERDPTDTAPRLLGRATPCVGRERELALLEATFAECVEDSVARAVLVIGDPGMGKSRLRQEFLQRIQRRDGAMNPWIGRGDPLSRGSAFCILAQALRRATGVIDGEPLAARRQKLGAGVARHVPASQVRRVTEFLGELIDAPVPEAEESDELRAARRDPLALGDQMRRAVEAFLLAESSAHPVTIVLEDLHWGDLPTVSFIGAALRALEERPFFILALARPDVHDVFPRLWTDREVQVIRLPKLTRRVSERLVRQVLGDGRSPEMIAALVERADGNAFYLEELIRAEAERRGGALPETVLAMVQSRLEGMEPGARRVLRAASVFGRTFWRGGVATLLNGALVDEWLTVLVEREVISSPSEARFPGDVEYTFRHAIVQEAAYTMLTEDDRALAHGVAGEWLEVAGETDALVLAQHFERGGVPARAASCCQRAAEQALRGNDLDAAIDLGVRGLRLGVIGEERASLETTLLEAYGWRNDWAATATRADEVFRREPPGTRPWCIAAMGMVWSAPVLNRYDTLLEAVNALREVEPVGDGRAALVQALGAVVSTMLMAGMPDLARTYLERMEQVGASIEATDAFARGWMEQARGFWFRLTTGDPFHSLLQMRGSAAAFTAGHNPQQAMFAEVQAAVDAWHLGAWEEALTLVRSALREPSSTMGARSMEAGRAPSPEPLTELRLVTVVASYVLAMVQCDRGLLDEAGMAAERAIAAARAHGNRYLEGLTRVALAILHRRRGEPETAAEQAILAAELLANCPSDRGMSQAVLSAALLDRGRSSEALAVAREAHPAMATAPSYARGLIRLALVEALTAADEGAGAAALIVARDELLARAARIEDPALRASFLERVPQNARVLLLAGQLEAGKA